MFLLFITLCDTFVVVIIHYYIIYWLMTIIIILILSGGCNLFCWDKCHSVLLLLLMILLLLSWNPIVTVISCITAFNYVIHCYCYCPDVVIDDGSIDTLIRLLPGLPRLLHAPLFCRSCSFAVVVRWDAFTTSIDCWTFVGSPQEGILFWILKLAIHCTSLYCPFELRHCLATFVVWGWYFLPCCDILRWPLMEVTDEPTVSVTDTVIPICSGTWCRIDAMCWWRIRWLPMRWLLEHCLLCVLYACGLFGPFGSAGSSSDCTFLCTLLEDCYYILCLLCIR